MFLSITKEYNTKMIEREPLVAKIEKEIMDQVRDKIKAGVYRNKTHATEEALKKIIS